MTSLHFRVLFLTKSGEIGKLKYEHNTSTCMILDEKISFYEESDALEFKEWLAQFGCKAKISTIFDYFTEDVIRGSIDTIDEWCSEMSIEDEERAPIYQLIQQKNSNVKCAVEAILEGRLAGDVLYTAMDQQISDAKLLSIVMGNQSINNLEFSSERFNDEIFNPKLRLKIRAHIPILQVFSYLTDMKAIAPKDLYICNP